MIDCGIQNHKTGQNYKWLELWKWLHILWNLTLNGQNQEIAYNMLLKD